MNGNNNDVNNHFQHIVLYYFIGKHVIDIASYKTMSD